MKQQKDESAIEFLRRLVNWLNYEHESLLTDLPSVEAVIEYATLWDVYDTDLMVGIIEAIEDGEDPKPLADLIAKYKLPWTVPSVKEPNDTQEINK